MTIEYIYWCKKIGDEAWQEEIALTRFAPLGAFALTELKEAMAKDGYELTRRSERGEYEIPIFAKTLNI